MMTFLQPNARRWAARSGAMLVIALAAEAALSWGVEPPHASPPSADLGSAGLAALARQIPIGGPLLVSGVPVPGTDAPRALLVKRFQVFTDDARIVLMGPNPRPVDVPKTAYFSGTIEGDPESLAFVIVRETGDVSGLIQRAGVTLRLGQETARDGRVAAVTEPVDVEAAFGNMAARWRCGTDELPPLASSGAMTSPQAAAPAPAPDPGVVYIVELAIETDYEYFQIFGNTTDATNYAADLVAGASAVYERDVMATFTLSYLSLWDTPSDPWVESGTTCKLLEFGNYWSANRQAVRRDLAYFMSGQIVGGGVAWVGSLCGREYDISLGSGCPTLPRTGNKGGPYAFGGDFAGDFDVARPEPPVWDIIVLTHEMGHVFNSPHTHCYNDIPVAGDPVIDTCYNFQSGCWTGATSLPPDGGSIMSYCHMLAGGLANMNLWLGRVFSFGTRSERVTDRIRAKIEAVHASCLDPVLPPCSAAAVAAGPASRVCLNAPFTLDGSGSSAVSCPGNVLEYRWAGPGITAPAYSTIPRVTTACTTPGLNDYTLDVRCQGDPACAASDSLQVDASQGAQPAADAGGSRDVTVCELPVRIGTPATAGFVYAWTSSFGAGTLLDAVDVAQPNFVRSAAGTYDLMLTVTSVADPACSDTSSIVVTVRPGTSAGSLGNTLRAYKTVDDVALRWPTGLVSPDLCNVHRGSGKIEIDKSALPASYVAPVRNPAPLATGEYDDASALADPTPIFFYEAYGCDCFGVSAIR